VRHVKNTTLVARVRRTIRERALIAPGSTVLCACSGGPDSAALLACLARLADDLGIALAAASVDHGLRPEAGADVDIAAEQAKRVGVPFHALRVQVEPGPALQARARDQRYAVLFDLSRRLRADRLAVGHTQDDQAETVLARLLRGASIQGLRAIRPRRADGVIRPLIDSRRVAVHAFARECFEQVAIDRSNADLRFERVRIRSHVLPALEAENRALVPHLAQLADDAREHMQLIDGLVDDLWPRVATDPETLEISGLLAQPVALRKAVLLRFIDQATGVNIGRAELTQLDHIVCRRAGEVWLSAGYSVYIHASETGRLRVRKRSGDSSREG
jgi:tRNA(Ile)-lysidine synthase